MSYEVVGGEEEVLPGESVTVVVALEREMDEEAGGEVGPVPAPHYPGRRDEGWWLVVGDAKSNSLLAIKRVNLGKAVSGQRPGGGCRDFGQGRDRGGGWSHGLAGSGLGNPLCKHERERRVGCGTHFRSRPPPCYRPRAAPPASHPRPHAVMHPAPHTAQAKTKLEFAAPAAAAGTASLTLYFMCDSWLGCDQEYEFKLKVCVCVCGGGVIGWQSGLRRASSSPVSLAVPCL